MERDRQAPQAGLYVARKSCQAMREIIIVRSGSDLECLSRVRALVQKARVALDDEQSSALLAAVLAYAEDLYSPAGLEKWTRPRMSASNYLRLQILAKLAAFHNRISELETERLRPAQQILSRNAPL